MMKLDKPEEDIQTFGVINIEINNEKTDYLKFKNLDNLANKGGFCSKLNLNCSKTLQDFNSMSSSFLPTILAYSSFLPSVFVPLTGLVLPAVIFAFLFSYIEREDIA